MSLILKILSYLFLSAGVQCVHQVSWLPCKFSDEHVFVNNDNHTETQLIHRQAMLQFGKTGDAPVNPHGITFLITGLGSKVDLRRYIEGAEAEQLECELHRYSTEGIHVRWPVMGARDYNHWFSCTLRHTKGLFTVTSFLRHPSDQPPPGQQDYHKWPPIGDKEILTTTVAMVIKTQTPSVRAGLGSQQKLHCQFAVDHKGPDITVEWDWQHRGEKSRLFSHTSRTGQSQGTGVGLRGLAGGDASYTLPFTKMSSEGTYSCSVSVNPVLVSVDINLQIQERPRVSLSTGSTLSLLEGEDQRVFCDAEGYYPLDVKIDWYVQDPPVSDQRVGAPLPKLLENVLQSSHKEKWDKTYSLTAFFYLRASLRDSGKQFTCSVSHQSLRVPIKKSFILTVEDPTRRILMLSIGVSVVILMVFLYLFRTRRRTVIKAASLI
ncbi:tapasin-related protein-like isoform X2 [Centropristis striata]|uniref:tapasin-related protein-like isoform X2 n=1 Tax=Centropristis striata TaxID=184440 RepID=UPI0027E1C62A|nr:tapasin-related protein-like isoform X2 [Centropristis striata]